MALSCIGRLGQSLNALGEGGPPPTVVRFLQKPRALDSGTPEGTVRVRRYPFSGSAKTALNRKTS